MQDVGPEQAALAAGNHVGGNEGRVGLDDEGGLSNERRLGVDCDFHVGDVTIGWNDKRARHARVGAQNGGGAELQADDVTRGVIHVAGDGAGEAAVVGTERVSDFDANKTIFKKLCSP